MIDTSVLIAIERRDQIDVDLDAIANGDGLTISAITVSELFVGAELARSPDSKRRAELAIDSFLSRMTVLPFGINEARTYARLYAQLRSSGLAIGPLDLQIAATALAHDSAVVTLNIGEFSRVPGLRVQAPGW